MGATFSWYEDMSLCDLLSAAKTAYFLDLGRERGKGKMEEYKRAHGGILPTSRCW